MIAIKELESAFKESAETYRFLSQVFFKELSQEAIEQLAAAEYPTNTGNDCLDQGYRMINRYLKFKGSDPRTQLACEYARIFLAAGVYTETRDIAVPYESVFTSEEQLIMQDSRDDVYRRYVEDGFAVKAELREPEDHLAFELEYLAIMSMRAADLAAEDDGEGLARNMLRQLEFIDQHLLNWLPDLTSVAQKYAQLTFYIGMLLVAQGYLQESKAALAEILAAIDEGESNSSTLFMSDGPVACIA